MPTLKNKCLRAMEGLRDELRDFRRELAETPGAAGQLFRSLFHTSEGFLRTLGPAGEEIADGLVRVSRRSNRRAATGQQRVSDALRGMNVTSRERAAKAMNGRVSMAELSPEEQAAARRMSEVMDQDLRAAQLLEVQRHGVGRTRPIRGSGKPFPQVLNARGREVMDELREQGAASARARWVAQRMVDDGRFETIEEALDELLRFREQQMRGVNPYFERERVELPEELLEWDPAKVLPGLLERNARFLEGVREWGNDHEILSRLIGRVRREFSPGAARVVDDFFKTEFGVEGIVPEWSQKFFGTMNNWQTLSKLSGIFSWLLNYGQRFANTADLPVSAHWRAMKAAPPVAREWMRHTDEVIREVERSGAIRASNPLIELSDEAPLEFITRQAIRPFLAVARGNEFKSAIINKYALDANIERLIELNGDRGTLKRMMDSMRHLAIDPEGVVRRRLERSGLDMSPDEAAELIASGGRLTEAQYAAVMQKAVESEQFALNLITKPIWWSNNPALRLAWKFKTFGIRQTEFIWERAVKEFAYGNFMPAARFAAAFALMGEVYHVSRDLITGSDKSVTSAIVNQDPEDRDPTDIAMRIIGNMTQQGFFGLLADLGWGLAQWAGGPAMSTVQNLGRLAQDVAWDPTSIQQIQLAVRDFAREEVVPLDQVSQLLSQAEARLRGQGDRVAQYHRFRNQAFEFVRQQEAGGVPGRVQQTVQRALSGTESFQRGERSVRYRYISQALTAGDVDNATEYMVGLLENADDRAERGAIVDGIMASAQSQSPMGPIPGDLTREFLESLPEDRAEELRTLQQRWMRDFGTALREAVNRTR